MLIDYCHRKLGYLLKENSPRPQAVLEGFCGCLFDNNIPSSDNMILPAESGSWYNGVLSHTFPEIASPYYDSATTPTEQLGKFKISVPYDLSLISLRDNMGENTRYLGIPGIKILCYEFDRFVCERLIDSREKQENMLPAFESAYPPDHTLSLDIPFSPHSEWIVVVGSVNIDVTLNVNELPQPGRTISTSKHSVIPGDERANQVAEVAKLESEVSLIGRVGNDYDSSLVYSHTEEYHVDTQGIKRDSLAETGKAYIHVQNDGESMTILLVGANQNLTPADTSCYGDLFEHCEYCLLQTKMLEAAILEVARLAHAHGVKNVSKSAVINRIGRSLMQYIDIFVPNRREAEILCPGIPDVEGKADAFLAMSVKTVIITLGHHGCYIKDTSLCGYLPTADLIPVDTTGAADAFISTLAAYLQNGYSLVNAVKIATYVVGFCVSRQGVIPVMIDRNSLEAYIARKEPEFTNCSASRLLPKSTETL